MPRISQGLFVATLVGAAVATTGVLSPTPDTRTASIGRPAAAAASVQVDAPVSATLPTATTASALAPRVETDRNLMDSRFYMLLYRFELKPRWTGSTSTCTTGSYSATAQVATLDSINLVRSMAGLSPVGLSSVYTSPAQRAALMMDANDKLSHSPTSSWRCYTYAGAQAAGRSNIGLNVSGADAVYWYMNEPGASNTAVGHRRWLLNPTTTTMGIGMTDRASAIYVVGPTSTARNRPEWISWPSAGYFPSGMEPSGRWSLSSSKSGTDFSRATVTVSNASGRVAVTKYPVVTGYGPDTLVWQVSGLPRTLAADVTYRVSVSGIRRNGVALPTVSYPVTLMAMRSLGISSGARVGATTTTATNSVPYGQPVKATVPVFQTSATTIRYQWLRDGTAISGATGSSYTPGSTMIGHRLSVRITGERRGYRPTTSTSPAVLVGR